MRTLLDVIPLGFTRWLIAGVVVLGLGVSGHGQTPRQVTLAWDAGVCPAGEVCKVPTHYQLFRCMTLLRRPACAPTVPLAGALVDAQTLTYTDTTVTSGRQYYYRVAAVDTTISGAEQLIGSMLDFVSVDSEEPPNVGENAIDGDTDTFWHTESVTTPPPHPHTITVGLGEVREVVGAHVYHRGDWFMEPSGSIAAWAFYVSLDGITWGTPVAAGAFDPTQSGGTISFAPVDAQYVRLVALSERDGNPWTSLGELRVVVTMSPYSPLSNTVRYPRPRRTNSALRGTGG